ncbi:hypothetical protein DP939_08010 [Spongiactinospora rosea]|uniref:N-acetyltransferase domain-containing protein n=1 Tax=Spongiactinospora rosea TaxID=2248750 RepID=A0A366M481_9ACTN|nr:hypothetical protein [Spongiactinospora rosea]RBQ20991.1 hypothetical protein DP939_08010 [Spongiactinospora rosea]
MSEQHPLLDYFLNAADGRFPEADGGATVVPALPDGLECSVAFTGHAVVATALPYREIEAHRPDGYGACLAPGFLCHLAGPQGWVGVTDVTLVARGTGGPPRLPERADADRHPRVRFARETRGAVRVHGDARGLVTLAHGLAGRLELGIEATRPGQGTGAALLRDALTLIPAGHPIFAAIAPGNARSLRSFLTTGFTPIGSEALIRPARPR